MIYAMLRLVFWHSTVLQVVASAIIYYRIVVNLENIPPKYLLPHKPQCNISFMQSIGVIHNSSRWKAFLLQYYD